jgi:hypothetical protein
MCLLARKGLPHPSKCPLCDQEDETINHLLLSCVFSHQVWFIILQSVGLQALAPQIGDLSFDDWWDQSSKRVEGQNRKGLNSIIILVAWSLWNHRNGCVFDGRQPSLNGLLSAIKEELICGNWQGLEDWFTSSPSCQQVNLPALFWSRGRVFVLG